MAKTFFSSITDVTPVPIPFLETLIPGKNTLQGRIGQWINNQYVPEVGAYIYIYIAGFLINPPELNSDGSYKNVYSAIISDKDGYWSTGSFFFEKLPELQYGQTIVFRAKSLYKLQSERSTPYAIGSTPTPIDVGVISEEGRLRRPFVDEYSVTGRFSYWYNNATAAPLLNCANHVYVYVDGVHAGTDNPVIGEIFRNEIRGSNAVFPIKENIYGETLNLRVNNNLINVPLLQVLPQDSFFLLGIKDSINKVFTFSLPSSNVRIRVFKNGMRATETVDFQYSISNNSKEITVIFNEAPVGSDRLVALVNYNIQDLTIGETLNGVKDGVNTTFELSNPPKFGTLELFQNGACLTQGVDYTAIGSTITFMIPPESYHILIADYQPVTSTSSSLIITQIPQGIKDGVNNSFFIFKPNAVGRYHVYRNGQKQIEGAFNDYQIIDNVILKFNPWTIPVSDDDLLVTFYVTPITIKDLVNYLNNTTEFSENCLTASTINVDAVENFYKIEGTQDGINNVFPFPVENSNINFRIFKGGLRLKEKKLLTDTGDYFLDYVNSNIVFSEPPEVGTSLTLLVNFITGEYIVGEALLGTLDGINDTFQLSAIPKLATVALYRNGVRLDAIGSTDYTIANNNIVFNTNIPVPGDVLLVDYEIAYSATTYHTSITPSGPKDSINTMFSYPVQTTGTAVNVFFNGQLLTPDVDFTFNKNSIILTYIVPSSSDILFLDLINSALFLDNPNDQLKISSPFTLELAGVDGNYSTFDKILFGDSAELYPGKNEKGEFYFWINRLNGYWKWSWYNPITKVITPFKKGQKITARAYNESPFIYKKAI